MARVSIHVPRTGPFQRNPASDGFFPSDARRLDLEDTLTGLLAEAVRKRRRGGVAPSHDFAAAEAMLAPFDFATETELEDVLRWVIHQMGAGITQVGHPKYFGLFNPAPSFASECADRIAALFNAQLASATTSPFPVAVERHVIRAVAQRLGMPASASGHFTAGGSEANATAVIAALTRAEPAYAQDGIGAFKGAPRIYVSREAHLAWLKIGHQTGIGRNAIRLVATDGTGRMDSAALARSMAADCADGLVPVLVVSTAGTTVAGMIDDMHEHARIARRFSAWHHVDAAWGGGLMASAKLAGALAGIELADSITIDAHKWLAATMGCGMFITPHPEILAQAFHVTMDCMPSNNAAIDPYVTSLQWSRRFLGIRLFVGLATSGWDGYARHIENSVALARLLRTQLQAVGWEIANDSPLGVLCLLPPRGAQGVGTIVDRIVKSGEAWISSASFEGETVLRVCITNGKTSQDDVLRLAELLRIHSQAVPASRAG